MRPHLVKLVILLRHQQLAPPPHQVKRLHPHRLKSPTSQPLRRSQQPIKIHIHLRVIPPLRIPILHPRLLLPDILRPLINHPYQIAILPLCIIIVIIKWILHLDHMPLLIIPQPPLRHILHAVLHPPAGKPLHIPIRIRQIIRLHLILLLPVMPKTLHRRHSPRSIPETHQRHLLHLPAITALRHPSLHRNHPVILIITKLIHRRPFSPLPVVRLRIPSPLYPLHNPPVRIIHSRFRHLRY